MLAKFFFRILKHAIFRICYINVIITMTTILYFVNYNKMILIPMSYAW